MMRSQGEKNLRETMAANDAGKKKQSQVNYRPAENDQTACGVCANFQPPNQCALVYGDISPTGTCDLFQPKQPEGQQPGGPMMGGQMQADAANLAGGM